MGNAKRAALRAAVMNTLLARVKEAEGDTRSEILNQLDEGDRLTASYKGQTVASVAVRSGRVTPSVVDPEKFAAYCAENYPTEVEMKPVVRQSFVAAVLQASRDAGQPCMPDGTPDVPGIAVKEGDPYVHIAPTAEAQTIVAQMVADGHVLPTGEIPQIEGGAL